MTRNELLGQLKKGNFNMLKQFPGLSSDESLMIEAYELNQGIVNYIDESLMQKESFFYELALINPEIIKGTEYAGKKDFMKRLVGHFPESVKFMQTRLFDDPVFVVELATSGAEAQVLSRIMVDEEIRNKLQRLPFGEYMYVDKFEISKQDEFIRRNEVPDELANNIEFMERAIARDISNIDKIGESILNDRESFNNLFRRNREAFIESMCEDYERVIKSDKDEETLNKYVQQRINQSKKVQEQNKSGSSYNVGHFEEKKQETNGQKKDNTGKFIKATSLAIEDDCLEEFVSSLEAKLEKRSKELESSDPEKVKKAENAVRGLTKKISDAKEKMKTPEGRKLLIEENKDNQTFVSLQIKEDIERKKGLPRVGLIDIDEAMVTLSNQNASAKSLADKFGKTYSGVFGKIDVERYNNKEKKITNRIEYFIQHPEELEKRISHEGDRELARKWINVYQKAIEKERAEKEQPSTIDENTRESIREELRDKSISLLKDQEQNIAEQMKLATPEEKVELGGKLKGIRTKIKNLDQNKGIDKNVRELIKETGDEELKDLQIKEIQATVVVVAQRVGQGKVVSEQELRKAANDSNRYFAQQCPDVYAKIEEIMQKENPGNKNKPVLEYLNKNPHLMNEVIPNKDSEEMAKVGAWLEPFEKIQTAIVEGKGQSETEKSNESKEEKSKEQQNTRDEEK